jgi:hypothetical protein
MRIFLGSTEQLTCMREALLALITRTPCSTSFSKEIYAGQHVQVSIGGQLQLALCNSPVGGVRGLVSTPPAAAGLQHVGPHAQHVAA